MKILGIDYGRKKIGLAIADGPLAEPLKVVRFESLEKVLEKVEDVVKKEEIERVVVGVSERKMGIEQRVFGKSLKEKLSIPVVFQDETLTTHEAQELSIKAGIKRKKRRALEDAYSAALILQSYIDSRRV